MADIGVRTREELNNLEFNYFVAFKVNVTDKDPKKIEASIMSVVGGAASTSGSVYIRRLIELKKDAIEVMCNDATYDEETKTYKVNTGARLKEAEKAKKMKIQDAVELVQEICSQTKKIFKSQLINICSNANKSANYFSIEELIDALAYIEKMGIKIIDNTKHGIPFTEYKKVDQLLENIQKRDLYEYLELEKNASDSDISKASSNLYAQGQKSNDKKKKQVTSNLDGFVKKFLLKGPDERKKYNEYILLKDEVWDELDKRKTYGIKELQMEEYLHYAKVISDILKCSNDVTENYLAAGLSNFNLTLVGVGEGVSLAKCPYDDCGKLYPVGAKICPHCGKPLEIACWNCSNKMPFTVQNKICPTCKTSYQSKELFINKLSIIDKYLIGNKVEISQLKSFIFELKNIVPHYINYKNTVVSNKITEYEKIIDEKIKQEETIGKNFREEIKKINILIKDKKFFTAYGLLPQFKEKYQAYNSQETALIVNTINKTMGTVQDHIRNAKLSMVKNDERTTIFFIEKALEICNDCYEAMQILQKFPPQPITNLLLEVIENKKVRVSWNKTVSAGNVTYTVVKKIGSKPTSIEDGTILDQVSLNFYEDENLVSSTPYYYAVFVNRLGVTSSIVTSNNSVQVFKDVVNIVQEVVEGSIKVKWEKPHNFKKIEVWKKAGSIAPLKQNDGELVKNDGDGFVDSSSFGETSYLILCYYEINGKEYISKGVKCTLKKYDTLSSIKDIKLIDNGYDKFVYTFKNESVGKVKLFISSKKLNIKFNEIYKLLDFNKICKELKLVPNVESEENKIIFSLPENQILWSYLILENEQLFIVSDPILINTIIPIKDINYETNNCDVEIKGVVNPKVKELIVKNSKDDFVTDINDESDIYIIPIEKYKENNAIKIKLKLNTINHLSIFGKSEFEGKSTFTKGVILEDAIDIREKEVVQYTLSYDTSPLKPFIVKIKFSSKSPITIPNLILLQGRPKPLNRNEGTLVENIKEFRLKKGLFSSTYSAQLSIKVPPCGNGTKFALFLKEEKLKYISIKEVKSL